jgi:prepilin-type processing-associated H-X9-DG protein
MSRFIRIFAGLGGLIFIGLILFPVFGSRHIPTRRSVCQYNLKQIGFGFMQYIQDYNERMPLVMGDSGWASLLQPYLKSNSLFQCPSESSSTEIQTDPALTGYSDYFYNAQLKQLPLSSFNEVWRTVMAAEGNNGQENTNAAYAKTQIPAAWRSDTASPAYRHLDTANYLFADGHVKASKVAAISTNWKKDGLYFQAPKLESTSVPQ